MVYLCNRVHSRSFAMLGRLFSWPAVLALLLSPCGAAVPAGQAGQPSLPRTRVLLAAGGPLTVICFGDSVTGIYYHTGSRRAYTDMVAIALRQAFPRASINSDQRRDQRQHDPGRPGPDRP